MALAHLLLTARKIKLHNLHHARIGQIGHRRIIEGEVAVLTDPETAQIDRSFTQ